MLEIENINLSIFEDLKCEGSVSETDGYCTVAVDQEFLSRGFLLIKEEGCELPKYPAHISVIYPEELIREKIFEKKIKFKVKTMGKILIENKFYFALILDSKELEEYRKSLGLSTLPSFKNVQVPFHITVGTKLFPK